MKLFLVQRTDAADYDEHDEAVVRAENAERAAEFAAKYLIGISLDNVEVAEIPMDGEEDIILGSFRAG